MPTNKPHIQHGLQRAFPYPRSTSGATSDLGKELIKSIQKSGPMTFFSYMEQCLYHPIYGYYSRPTIPTASKKGDFMTSVSVGPVFGILLAHRIYHFWKQNGSPGDFTVLELGGHDGTLARDFLAGAQTLDPEFATSLQYCLSEQHPDRLSWISENLKDQVQIIRSPSELNPKIGVVFANEVLDALPVSLYHREDGRWNEVGVQVTNSQLEWDNLDTSFELEGDYQDGYVTEGQASYQSFLQPFVESFQQSLFIFIDYGLDRESLYHPHRTAGTLRCYKNHRTNHHPLDDPGLCDLTADVNFTALTEDAQNLGLQPYPILNQSRYLTYLGRQWLLENPTPHEIRQFQTLIHPNHFGGRFYAAEFTSGEVSRGFMDS